MSDTTQTTAGLRAYFDGLEKRLEHAVKNARGNGLDVDALEARGVLHIGLARRGLAGIARNLAATEATQANRDKLLTGEAWPGSAALLEDYRRRLEKLELERLEIVSFIQERITQIRAYQWEKMGAEEANDLVYTVLRTGADSVKPAALTIMADVLQDPETPPRLLGELKAKTDLAAKLDKQRAALADLATQTSAEHREQGATLADTRDRLPPVLAKAAEVDRHETNLARTFQKATAEWGLTERQKRILALHVQDKTAKAIGQDKEVRLKERQVRYELATINAVFLQKTGQSLSSRKRATREEVAEGAPWTGNVTQPDTLDDGADPDNLDRDGLDWDRDK